jgi:ADP-ribosylation factor-like protein 1
LENVNLQIWDLGGQKTFRNHWRSYFPNTQGLIFIIDSSDRARLDLAKQELLNVLSEDDLKTAPLLVLANKQDLPDALSESFISNFLDLDSMSRPAKVFASSSKQASSEAGLLWLISVSESN